LIVVEFGYASGMGPITYNQVRKQDINFFIVSF